MAFHFRATISARNLCRFLLVGPEGDFASCFLLGRLARVDADLRILPNLRRENRNIRHAYAPAGFCDVPDMVRHCCGAFTVPAERYVGHLLHVWRSVDSAIGYKPRPKSDS